MLLLSIVRPAVGSSGQMRTERRVNWKLPDGVTKLAEYWLQSAEITAIAVFETDAPEKLFESKFYFSDAYTIDTFPAVTAEDGMKIVEAMRK